MINDNIEQTGLEEPTGIFSANLLVGVTVLSVHSNLCMEIAKQRFYARLSGSCEACFFGSFPGALLRRRNFQSYCSLRASNIHGNHK